MRIQSLRLCSPDHPNVQVMAKATTLVIISGQEDISMSEDAPSKMALYAYQASLIDKVWESLTSFKARLI